MIEQTLKGFVWVSMRILGLEPLAARFWIIRVVAALAVSWCAGAVRGAEPDVRRDATVEAVERVLPSVVNIATETVINIRDPFEEMLRQFFDPYRRQAPNSQV